MVRHLVMWQLKDFANNQTKQENAVSVKKHLEALKNEIPELKALEVGIDLEESPFSNYDMVLDTKFDSLKDLENYQNHPKHKDIAKWIGELVESRASVDYEY